MSHSMPPTSSPFANGIPSRLLAAHMERMCAKRSDVPTAVGLSRSFGERERDPYVMRRTMPVPPDAPMLFSVRKCHPERALGSPLMAAQRRDPYLMRRTMLVPPDPPMPLSPEFKFSAVERTAILLSSYLCSIFPSCLLETDIIIPYFHRLIVRTADALSAMF